MYTSIRIQRHFEGAATMRCQQQHQRPSGYGTGIPLEQERHDYIAQEGVAESTACHQDIQANLRFTRGLERYGSTYPTQSFLAQVAFMLQQMRPHDLHQRLVFITAVVHLPGHMGDAIAPPSCNQAEPIPRLQPQAHTEALRMAAQKPAMIGDLARRAVRPGVLRQFPHSLLDRRHFKLWHKLHVVDFREPPTVVQEVLALPRRESLTQRRLKGRAQGQIPAYRTRGTLEEPPPLQVLGNRTLGNSTQRSRDRMATPLAQQSTGSHHQRRSPLLLQSNHRAITCLVARAQKPDPKAKQASFCKENGGRRTPFFVKKYQDEAPLPGIVPRKNQMNVSTEILPLSCTHTKVVDRLSCRKNLGPTPENCGVVVVHVRDNLSAISGYGASPATGDQPIPQFELAATPALPI